jgi:hypothetical protein
MNDENLSWYKPAFDSPRNLIIKNSKHFDTNELPSSSHEENDESVPIGAHN